MKPLPTWRQMNMDTSPEVEAIHIGMLRELPDWRKAQMLARLSRMAARLALMGLRDRFPEATEEELHLRYVEQIYPPEVVTLIHRAREHREGLGRS